MKKSNKNRWIPILMTISQALLTAFVVYWLFGQYNDEKEALNKQLYYEFSEAENEALDSTLHIILSPLYKSVNAEKIIHLDIRDSSRLSSGKASYEITAMPHQEAVMRGVRMIVKMSSDSLEIDGAENPAFPAVDSILVLSNISKRIDSLDYTGLKKIWYHDSLYEKNAKRISFEASFSSPGMVLEFTNYEPLLFKMIFPQVLFAFFLVLLSASAFIIAYRSLERQVMLNTLRNEFVSNVSHELKTPVATVKVALESLRNFDLKNDPAVSDEYLSMAALEMDRLDQLIEKILNQSLLESRRVIMHKQKGDLVKLAQAVINSLKPRIDSLSGRISLNAGPGEADILMDELYIRGVILTLLDNALKYGGDPPEIEVNISRGNGSVFLSVLDNGEGIEKKYHNKIFERFFRVPSHNRHNVKGYGLGLSFAAQVMQQHGGSIKVDNGSSGGCLFTLSFHE